MTGAMSYRSMRRDAFYCLLINCLLMALMVIVLIVTLHSPQPVIFIGVDLAHQHNPPAKTAPSTLSKSVSKLTSVIANKQLLHKDKYDVVSTTSSQLTSHTSLPPTRRTLTPSTHHTTSPVIVHKNQQVNHALERRSSQNISKSPSKVWHTLNYSAPSVNQSLIERVYQSIGEKPPKSQDGHRSFHQPQDTQQSSSAQSVQSMNRTIVNTSQVHVYQSPQFEPTWNTLNVKDDTAAQFAFKHDVLPLVTFIDTRPRYNHINATVMLVQVRDVKRCRYNRIIGCGVDGQRATAYRVKPLFVYRNWIRSNVPNMTHSEAVVMCYDLPSKNGSKAYVLYRPVAAKGIMQVFSERPVHVTKAVRDVKPLSVVVCTTVYGRPPWLSEWLRYQQTVGVDYIHLYAQHSFVEQGGMSSPELQQLLGEQRLTVDVRTAYLNTSEVYYYSQPLHYQDCLLRYRGVYEFAMLIDTDDFFVPRVPNQPDIHYYVHELFHKRIASVKLDWIRYFPSCGLRTPPDQIKDGNLTAHLSTYKSYKQYVKSIHRLDYVSEAAIHEVTYLLPGFKKANASNTIAYVAHIRQSDGCHDDEQLMKDAQYKDS